jgi:hypothetical protein
MGRAALLKRVGYDPNPHERCAVRIAKHGARFVVGRDWGCGGILSDGEGRGDVSADGRSADERFLRRRVASLERFVLRGRNMPKIKKAQAGAGAFLFLE